MVEKTTTDDLSEEDGDSLFGDFGEDEEDEDMKATAAPSEEEVHPEYET